MGRNLTEEFFSEIASGHLLPALFVEADFKSGTVRMWSGMGKVQWNGQDWYGSSVPGPDGELKQLGDVTPASETTEVRADNFTIALSGIPVKLISTVLDECRPNKLCTLYLGALNLQGKVIDSPSICCRGYMDVPTINDAGDTCTVSITVESRLARLQKASPLRYTDECQRALYPDDGFFRFVPSIQDWNGTW